MGDTAWEPLNPDTHKLGDCEVEFDGSLMTIYDEDNNSFSLKCPHPHELRKIAKYIEDHNRLREFGEDSNHIA